MAIKSFGAYISEDAQLLLEYDQEQTWKQHGKKALNYAISAAHDNHPLTQGIRLHYQNNIGHHDDLVSLHTKDKDGEDVTNIHSHMLLNKLESGDPTPNKKYVQHIARIYGSGGMPRLEDTHRMNTALSKFDDLSRRKILPPEHRDIGRIKSLSDLEDLVDAHSERMSGKEEDKAHHEKMKSQATITDHPDFTHIIPHTQEASSHFGKGTRWCTTMSGADEHGMHGTMFDQYNDEGPLHILIPKKPRYPGEKYQYHYASNSFMNERDEGVSHHPSSPEAPHAINKFVNDYKNKANLASHNYQSALEHPEPRVLSTHLIQHGTDESIHRYLKSDKATQENVSELIERAPGKIKPEHISTMMKNKNPVIRMMSVYNDNATKEHVLKALKDPDYQVRRAAFETGIHGPMGYGHRDRTNHITPKHIDQGLDDPHEEVRSSAIENSAATPENISKALKDKNPLVRRTAISHKNATPEHITQALHDEDDAVARSAIEAWSHKVTPEHMHQALKRGGVVGQGAFSSALSNKFTSDHVDTVLKHHDPTSNKGMNMYARAAQSDKATRDQLHDLFDRGTESTRRSVIENPNASSAHLDKGVNDPNEVVRAAVAKSPSIRTRHVDILSNDKDEHVRHSLLSPYHVASNKLKPHHIKNIINASSDWGDNAAQSAAASNMHDEDSFNAALNHPSPRVRSAAARSQYARPEHKMKLLNDPESTVRHNTVDNIGRYDHDLLRAAFKHPDIEIQRRALNVHGHAITPHFAQNHPLHNEARAAEGRVDEYDEKKMKEADERRQAARRERFANADKQNTNESLMSFSQFISEDYQLLLEYDANLTWKQHGEKVKHRVRGAWESTQDDHIQIAKAMMYDQSDGVRTPEQEDHAMRKHILSHIEKTDPTPNKKYVQHIARIYGSGGVDRFEDLHARMKPALEHFHDLANRKVLPPEHRDIGRVKSLGQLEDLVDQYGDKKSQKETDREHHEKMKSQATIEDHQNFTRIIPHSAAAADHFGKGTRWCTTGTHGANMFKHYNKQGPLQIFIPKNPHYPGEKYQYHYASGQFMNEQDKAASEMHGTWNNRTVGERHSLTDPEVHSFVKNYQQEADRAGHDKSGLTHLEPKVAENALRQAPNINKDDLTHAMKGGAAKLALDNPLIDHSHVQLGLKHKDPEVRLKTVQQHADKLTSEDIHKAVKSDARTAIAALKAPHATREHAEAALNHPEAQVKIAALGSSGATSSMIDKALNHKNPKTRAIVVRNAENEKVIDKGLKDPDHLVRWAAITNNAAKPRHFDRAMKDEHMEVRLGTVSRRNAPPRILEKGANDPDPVVRAAARGHLNAKPKNRDRDEINAFAGSGRKKPYPLDKRSRSYVFTHVPGNEKSEDRLKAVKIYAKNHNATSDQKLKVDQLGRLGKGHPEGRTLMRSSSTRMPLKKSTRVDVYLAHRHDNPPDMNAPVADYSGDWRERDRIQRNKDKITGHPVFEETLTELSKDLLHKYVKRAKKSVEDMENEPYTDEHDSKVFKRKAYISFVQHARLNKEQINEGTDYHCSNCGEYLGKESEVRANAHRGRIYCSNCGHTEGEKRKYVYWKNGVRHEIEEEQLDEKAPPGAKYERMVKHIKHGYIKHGKLSKKEKSIAYATAWKAYNHAHEEIEPKERTRFSEFIQLDERQLRTPVYLASVGWRNTKKPHVRHRKNGKMKGMYDWNRTQYVTRLLYRNRNQHDTQHLTSRSKHQLTDRWRDQRLVRLHLLKHNKSVHEDKQYLQNRELLHSAHAQAGREIGKRERDPELKRIHLHRARKHQHAAKVLEIIRMAKEKKKKK